MKRIKLLSFFAAAALVLFLGSCANDDIAQQPTGTGDTPTDEATFEAAPAAPTRTTMSNTGVFKWQSGDKIWVKDDTGAWRQSSNAPTSETASFKFKVPGTFTASNTYTVYYPGNGGNQDQVTISASQSQADPNAPFHVGVSGDCGWATATAASGTKRFNFTLDHKAAFLVFSPYCSNNTVLNSSDVKLTKIEVTSDNNLVGTYTLDPATNQLTGTGSGKQINLTTGGSATPNGFSVPTSATPATNASYVVIKPGTHTLKVRFWIKDYVTNIEGTVTKLYPSFSYAANTYYTMSSELKITNYTTPYYMWDAQEPYWKDHEWDLVGHDDNTNQPTVNGKAGSAYPQSQTAAPQRWYNPANYTTVADNYARQAAFTNLPNINELSWYVMKGDPRWDGDELWTTMGHLYKGGMWFKKAAKIAADHSITPTHMKNVSFDGSTDLRTTYKFFSIVPAQISRRPLSAADQANYFYLPALGYYLSGGLKGVGSSGLYWSSSAVPNDRGNAYNLGFVSDRVYVSNYHQRINGYSVRAFE